MSGHPCRFILALCVFGVTLPSLGQGTPKKKGPAVQELQQQVKDLQQKLMECQNTVKATAPNPLKDALEAFQTFNSTVETGANQAAYKAALVPLKVAVDKLPDNEQTAPMKKTLEMLIDAGNLWNISITKNSSLRGKAVPIGNVSSYMEKYQDEWNKLDSEGRARDPRVGGCYWPLDRDKIMARCVKDLGMVLVEKGRENINGFPKP